MLHDFYLYIESNYILVDILLPYIFLLYIS